MWARAAATYGTVLENDALVRDEERLERSNDAPQVRLVLLIVVHPLRVQHVVHRHQAVLSSQNKHTRQHDKRYGHRQNQERNRLNLHEYILVHCSTLVSKSALCIHNCNSAVRVLTFSELIPLRTRLSSCMTPPTPSIRPR